MSTEIKTSPQVPVIEIPAQFEYASDSGYLAAHEALTNTLKSLTSRPDKAEKVEFVHRDEQRKKDEYFDQACENVARAILMDERTITSVPESEARALVLAEYNSIIKNPRRADSSRGAAVH